MKKIYYIHLPKTGGTSITKFIRENYPSIEIIEHGTLPKNCNFKTPMGYNSGTKEILNNDSYFFASLRNPYDYWVSNFFYGRKHTRHNHWFWFNNYKRDDIKNHFKLFVNYVYDIYSNDQRETEILTSYYNCFCYDKNKNLLLNNVVKLENLNNDLLNIFEENNLKINISPEKYFEKKENVLNKTTHNKYDFYYTEEIKNRISEMEQKIINKYNYVF